MNSIDYASSFVQMQRAVMIDKAKSPGCTKNRVWSLFCLHQPK